MTDMENNYAFTSPFIQEVISKIYKKYGSDIELEEKEYNFSFKPVICGDIVCIDRKFIFPAKDGVNYIMHDDILRKEDRIPDVYYIISPLEYDTKFYNIDFFKSKIKKFQEKGEIIADFEVSFWDATTFRKIDAKSVQLNKIPIAVSINVENESLKKNIELYQMQNARRADGSRRYVSRRALGINTKVCYCSDSRHIFPALLQEFGNRVLQPFGRQNEQKEEDKIPETPNTIELYKNVSIEINNDEWDE